MKLDLHKEAIRLRTEEQLPYSEIKKKLKVSKSTLSAWLRDYPLSEKRMKELLCERKHKAEVGYERYRQTMKQKKEQKEKDIYLKYKKRFKDLDREVYFSAGLMLYLAEGQKRRSSLKLSNSDPEIIKFFMDWCKVFLNVEQGKFRIQLHLYEGMELEKETKFWQNTLNLDKSQIWKTQVRPLRESSFTYSSSHRHGTCSLYVGGAKIWREVMFGAKALMSSFDGIK